MNRITWTDNGYGNSWRGRVTIKNTSVGIATVGYNVIRDDPDKPWVLRTEIPGYRTDRRHATAATLPVTPS